MIYIEIKHRIILSGVTGKLSLHKKSGLVSVLERCESAINVQVFLGLWSNDTTICSLDLCNFNTVLDVFEELHCSVEIWVGVLCHLLKLAVPSYNAVLL